jgi:hypothetical protein
MRTRASRFLSAAIMLAGAALNPHPAWAGDAAPARAPGTVSGDGVKWHPGNYVWLDPHASVPEQLRMIDSLADEGSVQGIQLIVNWVRLEGATAGDYAAGFAMVDSVLAHLGSQKHPKRLILGLQERSFGAPYPAGTSCADASERVLPRYVAELPGGGCVVADKNAAGALAVVAKVWQPAVMDRLIALSEAYARRYDANPLLEMFYANGETAVAAPRDSDFSVSAYDDQLRRWFDASEKAWPHTQLRALLNWFGSDSQMLHMMKYLAAKPTVALGGPDPELPLPEPRPTQSNRLFRGEGGGPDFRGKIVWVGEVQAMGLGLKFTQKPAEILQYEASVMHASYMIWLQNNFAGGPEQRWKTGVLPFLRSSGAAGLAVDCPARYGKCITD